MKDKLRKHINNQSIIEEIKVVHGYPIYPINKDDFENLLKKVTKNNHEKFPKYIKGDI